MIQSKEQHPDYQKPDTFSNAVVHWYAEHGRKHLPWQQNITPYRVWVSEIMLQQTQVDTVIAYFERFMQHFDNVITLANAPQDQVLHLWTGLGYYARARNLHAAAKIVAEKYEGCFPKSVEALCELPGIGRSTAGAIASLSMDIPAAILDGNVKRVLARVFAIDGWPGKTKTLNELWSIAETLNPKSNNRQYTQAMMDIGATLCKRRNPECNRCPVAKHCLAYQQANPHEYPGKKPKKTLPVKQTYFYIYRNERGEVLLEKRPPSGIWGGLWSFPETCDDKQRQGHAFVKNIVHTEHLSPIRHTFSHYHLDITPKLIDINMNPNNLTEAETKYWYHPEKPANIGLPKPVASLIQSLTDRTPLP